MRHRNETTAAERGGIPCPELHQTDVCNDQASPIDCVVSEWEPWSDRRAEKVVQRGSGGRLR